MTIRVTNISNLEARLLSTLDALDALQASSLSEIEHGSQTILQLRRRLALLETTLQNIENERDDLKDAVLRLVERGGWGQIVLFGAGRLGVRCHSSSYSYCALVVEMSNDYSNWPRCRIQVAGSLAVAPAPLPSPPPIANASNGSNIYTASIIQELSRKLVSEQNAHAQTVKEADVRIASLEAKVARRDAELEYFILTGRTLPSNLSVRAPSRSDAPAIRRRTKTQEPPVLSQQEAAEILSTAAARNRALEAEVYALANLVKSQYHVHAPI